MSSKMSWSRSSKRWTKKREKTKRTARVERKSAERIWFPSIWVFEILLDTSWPSMSNVRRREKLDLPVRFATRLGLKGFRKHQLRDREIYGMHARHSAVLSIFGAGLALTNAGLGQMLGEDIVV